LPRRWLQKYRQVARSPQGSLIFLQKNNEVLFLLNGLPYRKRWFNRINDTSLMSVLFPEGDWYDLEMFVREQHRSLGLTAPRGGGILRA
jgi:hypothetical protein